MYSKWRYTVGHGHGQDENAEDATRPPSGEHEHFGFAPHSAVRPAVGEEELLSAVWFGQFLERILHFFVFTFLTAHGHRTFILCLCPTHISRTLNLMSIYFHLVGAVHGAILLVNSFSVLHFHFCLLCV